MWIGLLLLARPALAWEQVYVSAELTFGLGAAHPLGGAISAQFGEAPIESIGPELRAGAEVAVGPGGFALTPLVRVGVLAGRFGNEAWKYYPVVATYGEVGWSVRPGSWSGLRVGGGADLYMAYLRYHQLVRLGPADPAPGPKRPTGTEVGGLEPSLPLAQRHPSIFPDLDMTVALAVEAWMLPGPFQSVEYYELR